MNNLNNKKKVVNFVSAHNTRSPWDKTDISIIDSPSHIMVVVIVVLVEAKAGNYFEELTSL